MNSGQPGILANIPTHARAIQFQLRPGAQPEEIRRQLSELLIDEHIVVGLGPSTIAYLGCVIPGLHEPPSWTDSPIAMPSTPAGLFIWLRGGDRGQLVHRGRAMEKALASNFVVDSRIDTFQYEEGRDLSGYVDGTENPVDEAAEKTAFAASQGPGIDGSSFLAIQKWRHNLDSFFGLSQHEQDNVFGRRRADNEEFASAPKSAHVKRTAQESFSPQAFVVRRSMPWVDTQEEGLLFKAFASSFQPFEMLLRQMLGLNDGVVDSLFRFSSAVSTTYFWCPPTRSGALDLRAIEKSV